MFKPNPSLRVHDVCSAIALGAAVWAAPAHAESTYAFDYTYDGIHTVVNATGQGGVLSVGDHVQASYHAAGGDHWTATVDTVLWTPQGLAEEGQRVGDLSWTFYLDGAQVLSGSETGQQSAFFHVPQVIRLTTDLSFDRLDWFYTLTSSTAAGNTLTGGDFGFTASLKSFEPGPLYVHASAVPEPGVVSFLLAGLCVVGWRVHPRRALRG